VVGLVSHFLAQYDNVQVGPHGREIYTDCVAAISMVISLIWLLPFTWTFMHYPLDFLLSFAWFAAFGALYSWIHINGIKCLGYFSIFHWDGVEHTDYCHQWMTAEAFCFMSGVFWLISALLVSWHPVSRFVRVVDE
jgi:Membrane-associating domain